MPLLAFLLAIGGVFGESAWWAKENKLPPTYILQKPLWLLGSTPLPAMVEIKPGKFIIMGCWPGRDDVEGAKCGQGDAAHEVTLTNPFEIGENEVTFSEYDYYVWDQNRKGKDVHYPPDQSWGRHDRPVINVSWDDAKAYAEWLTKKTGKHCRLPTEAEWEYAARAGTDTAYWWGSNFDQEKANCGGQETAPVNLFPENPWGLRNTAGNVFEWVEDGYGAYPSAPVTDPRGPIEGEFRVSRVLRGGAWGSGPGYCRAAFRGYFDPDYRYDYLGFRVCCSSAIE